MTHQWRLVQLNMFVIQTIYNVDHHLQAILNIMVTIFFLALIFKK
jgi:hypothetical protein